MKPYRYIKAFPLIKKTQTEIPSLKKTRRFSFSFWGSIFSLIAGLLVLGNFLVPVIFFQIALAPKMNLAKFVSPLPETRQRPALTIMEPDLSNQTGEVLSQQSSEPIIKTTREVIPEKESFADSLRPLPYWKDEVQEFSLSIPKLKIEDAKVVVSAETFDNNLAQMTNSAMPGERGNMVIIGHSILPQFYNPKNYKTIFSKLPELEAGDKIIVTIAGVLYRYSVQSLKIVAPSDWQSLVPESEDRFLTLLTCVPPGLETKRLLVKAVLEDWE